MAWWCNKKPHSCTNRRPDLIIGWRSHVAATIDTPHAATTRIKKKGAVLWPKNLNQ